ncbi:MAG: hypothetical protein E6K55_00315, partial [Gemmatimonadetes bacterium]
MVRPLAAVALGLALAPRLGAQAPAPAPPAPSASPPSARPFTPDDVLRLRDVREPRISPEGDWVAYTVSSADTAEDQNHHAVWMTSWDGTRTVRLTNSKQG